MNHAPFISNTNIEISSIPSILSTTNILIYGPPSSGKSSILNTLNFSSSQRMEINASNLRNFSSIKEILKSNLNKKVIFLDEVDYLTKDSFFILRKAMESEDRRFILTCNCISRVLPAIVSRCFVIRTDSRILLSDGSRNSYISSSSNISSSNSNSNISNISNSNNLNSNSNNNINNNLNTNITNTNNLNTNNTNILNINNELKNLYVNGFCDKRYINRNYGKSLKTNKRIVEFEIISKFILNENKKEFLEFVDRNCVNFEFFLNTLSFYLNGFILNGNTNNLNNESMEIFGFDEASMFLYQKLNKKDENIFREFAEKFGEFNLMEIVSKSYEISFEEFVFLVK